MPAESRVEKIFREEGKKQGALVLKFLSPGFSGVPDRIVMLRDGGIKFVELKAPGEKPRPLQQRVFKKFASYGWPVEVIDSVDKARAYWREEE